MFTYVFLRRLLLSFFEFQRLLVGGDGLCGLEGFRLHRLMGHEGLHGPQLMKRLNGRRLGENPDAETNFTQRVAR